MSVRVIMNDASRRLTSHSRIVLLDLLLSILVLKESQRFEYIFLKSELVLLELKSPNASRNTDLWFRFIHFFVLYPRRCRSLNFRHDFMERVCSYSANNCQDDHLLIDLGECVGNRLDQMLPSGPNVRNRT